METFLATASDTESPTTYLWALFFLVQHFSALDNQPRALELLDKALAHTPTLPDLHAQRGRVLKRAGAPLAAARALEDARLLDGQDRFLNTKAGKYRLRAGMLDEAQDILGLFTKVSLASGSRAWSREEAADASVQKDAASPGADLTDMQSLLYMFEEAAAYARAGKLGMALKRYTALHKVCVAVPLLPKC
jgi:hypothetical protein